MLWPQRETAACGLATASPTRHGDFPLNGLSSRESTIAPLASSNCDSDHIICDWRLTIGITFVALVFGNWVHTSEEPGRQSLQRSHNAVRLPLLPSPHVK